MRRRRPLPHADVVVLLAALSFFGEASSVAVTHTESFGADFEASKRWRITNSETVSHGWPLGEVRLFSAASCSADSEISRIPAPEGGDYDPDDPPLFVESYEASSTFGGTPLTSAFDTLTWTEWKAGCYRCEPSAAWLSVHFSKPVRIRCLRIWQRGQADERSSQVALQRWEVKTNSWQTVLSGTEMDGGRWDQLNFVQCVSIEVPDHGRVMLSNNGFYPSTASFSCQGARILSGFSEVTCNRDGSWNTIGGMSRRCWTLAEIVSVGSFFFVLEVVLFSGYYYCVVLPRDKICPPLASDAVMLEEGYRRWNNEFIVDAQRLAKPQLRFVLGCPCCRLAQTWRMLDLIPWLKGALLVHFCWCFIPCIGAYYRGQIRERLQIEGKRSHDLLSWGLCCCFAATQEAKHLDDTCQQTHERKEEVLRMEIARREEIEKTAREKAQRQCKVKKEGVSAAAQAALDANEEERPKKMISVKSSRLSLDVDRSLKLQRRPSVLELGFDD